MTPSDLIALVARLREAGASVAWMRAIVLAASRRGVSGIWPALIAPEELEEGPS